MDSRIIIAGVLVAVLVIGGGIYVVAGIGDAVQLSDAVTMQVELSNGETKYCNTTLFDGAVCGFAGDGDPALIDNCADDPPHTCFKFWTTEKDYQNKQNSIVCPRDFLQKNLEKSTCSDTQLSARSDWSIYLNQTFYLQDNGVDYVCHHSYDENNVQAMYSENCTWELLGAAVPEGQMRVHWDDRTTYLCDLGATGYERWRDNLCQRVLSPQLG